MSSSYDWLVYITSKFILPKYHNEVNIKKPPDFWEGKNLKEVMKTESKKFHKKIRQLIWSLRSQYSKQVDSGVPIHFSMKLKAKKLIADFQSYKKIQFNFQNY